MVRSAVDAQFSMACRHTASRRPKERSSMRWAAQSVLAHHLAEVLVLLVHGLVVVVVHAKTKNPTPD